MKLKNCSQITAIDRFLSEGKYTEAELLLEKLKPISKIESARYIVLKSDAMLHQGLCNSNKLKSAIEILQPTNENLLYARAKFLYGWSLVREGFPLKAIDYLLEARLYFRRYKKYKELRKSLAILSQIAFQKLDRHSVEIYTNEIIDACESPSDKLKIPLYLANLGRTYLRVGEFSKAKKIFECNYNSLKNYSVNSFVNLSLSLGILNGLLCKYDIAHKSLNKIIKYTNSVCRESAIYYEYLGLIQILSGDYKEAEKSLKRGLKISLEIAPESALISQIKRLFGDLYIATAKYKQAEKYTNEALVVAEKIGEKVEIAACYRIFAQLEQHKGNNNRAKEYYHKAIDLFKLIGSRYELAVIQYLAATSGLYHNGERHAMLYMALDYFESEQVEPYLNKIESALKKKEFNIFDIRRNINSSKRMSL